MSCAAALGVLLLLVVHGGLSTFPSEHWVIRLRAWLGRGGRHGELGRLTLLALPLERPDLLLTGHPTG